MKELMKHIITASKVLGALGVIAGAALWFDGKFDAAEENDKEVLEMVEYNNMQISDLSNDVQGLHDTLERQEGTLENLAKQSQSLGWAIRNINNFTPEQLQEILNREFTRNRVYNRTSELEAIPIE